MFVECSRADDQLDLSVFAWTRLLQLALRHGWRPEDIQAEHSRLTEADMLGVYEPRTMPMPVSTRDAIALATALQFARTSLRRNVPAHTSGLASDDPADGTLPAFDASLALALESLAQFAACGGFAFVLATEAAT